MSKKFQYIIPLLADWSPLRQQLKDYEGDLAKLSQRERAEIQKAIDAKIEGLKALADAEKKNSGAGVISPKLKKEIEDVKGALQELKGLFPTEEFAKGGKTISQSFADMDARITSLTDTTKEFASNIAALRTDLDKLFKLAKGGGAGLGKSLDISGVLKTSLKAIGKSDEDIVKATKDVKEYQKALGELGKNVRIPKDIRDDVGALTTELEALMQTERALAEQGKTETVEYGKTIKKIMAYEKRRTKLGAEPMLTYDASRLADDFKDYEGTISRIMQKLSAEIDRIEAKLNGLGDAVADAFSKKIARIDVNLELSNKSKEALKNQVNTFIGQLNSDKEFAKVQLKFDGALSGNDKDIVGTKKFNEDIETINKEIEKTQNELNELLAKHRDSSKHLGVLEHEKPHQPRGSGEVEAIANEIKEKQELLAKLYASQESSTQNTVASIVRGLDRVDSVIDEKTKTWREKIAGAFKLEGKDIKVPFSAEHSAEMIFNEIQSFFNLEGNQIELHLNKEMLMQEIKDAVEKSGGVVGGPGGSVAFDMKDMAMAIATGLQAFFTGDFKAVTGEKKKVDGVHDKTKRPTYFDPANPFNRDVANSLAEVIKAGTDAGGKNQKIKDFFSAKGVDVEEYANASAIQLMEMLGQLTDRYGETIQDQFKSLMQDVGKGATASKVGNFIGDFRELLYTNGIVQTTVDNYIKREQRKEVFDDYIEKMVMSSGLGRLIGLTKKDLDINALKLPDDVDIEETLGLARSFANKEGLDAIGQQIEETRSKIEAAEAANRKQEAASLQRQLAALQSKQDSMKKWFDFYSPIVDMLEVIKEARASVVDVTNISQKKEFINKVKKYQETLGQILRDLAVETDGYIWGIEVEGAKGITEIRSQRDANRAYHGVMRGNKSKVKNAYAYALPAGYGTPDPRPDRTALRNRDTSIEAFEIKKDATKRWEAKNIAAIEASERVTESSKLVADTETRLANGAKREEALKTQINTLEDTIKKDQESIAKNEEELAKIADKKEAKRAKNRLAVINERLKVAKRENEAAKKQVEEYKDIDYSARDAEEKSIDAEIRKLKKWQKDPRKYRDDFADEFYGEEFEVAKEDVKNARRAEQDLIKNAETRKQQLEQRVASAEAAVERAKKYDINQDLAALKSLKTKRDGLQDPKLDTYQQKQEREYLDRQIKATEDRIVMARANGGNPYIAQAEAELEASKQLLSNVQKPLDEAAKAREKAEEKLAQIKAKIYGTTEEGNTAFVEESKKKIEARIRDKLTEKSNLMPNFKTESETRLGKSDAEVAKLEAEKAGLEASQAYQDFKEIDRLEQEKKDAKERIKQNKADIKKNREDLKNLKPEKTTQELLDTQQQDVDAIAKEIGGLESDLQSAKETVAKVETHVDDIVNKRREAENKAKEEATKKGKKYKTPGEIEHTQKNQKIIDKYTDASKKSAYLDKLISGEELPDDKIEDLWKEIYKLEDNALLLSAEKDDASLEKIKQINKEIENKRAEIERLRKEKSVRWSDTEGEAVSSIKNDRVILGYIKNVEDLFKDQTTGGYRDVNDVHEDITKMISEIDAINTENHRKAEEDGATEIDKARAQWSQDLLDQLVGFKDSYVENWESSTGNIKATGEEFESYFKAYFEDFIQGLNTSVAEKMVVLKPSVDNAKNVMNALQPEVEAAKQHLKDSYVKNITRWFKQIRDKQKIVAKGDAEGADQEAKNSAGLAAREISDLFPIIATAMANYKKEFGEELALAEDDAELFKNRSKYNYRGYIDNKTSSIENEIKDKKDSFLYSERAVLLKTRRGELLKDIKEAKTAGKATEELEQSLKSVNEELTKYRTYATVLEDDAAESVFYNDIQFANEYSAKVAEIINRENELDLIQAKGASQGDIEKQHTSINEARREAGDVLRKKLYEEQDRLLENIKLYVSEGKSVDELVKRLDIINQRVAVLDTNKAIREQTSLSGDLYKASTNSVNEYTNAIREAIKAEQELKKAEALGQGTDDAAKADGKARRDVKDVLNRARQARLNGPANASPRAQALDWLARAEEKKKTARAQKWDAERRKKQKEDELEALRTEENYLTSKQYERHYNALKSEKTGDYVHSEQYRTDREAGLKLAKAEMEKYLMEALRPAAERAYKAGEYGVDVDGVITPITVGEIENEFRQVLTELNDQSNMGEVKQRLMDIAKKHIINKDERTKIYNAIEEAVDGKTYDTVDIEKSMSEIMKPLTQDDASTDRVIGTVEDLLKQNVQKVIYRLMESVQRDGSKIDPKKFEEAIQLGEKGGWEGIATHFEKEFENDDVYKALIAKQDTARKDSLDSKLAELSTQRTETLEESARAIEEVEADTDKQFDKIEKQFQRILSNIKKSSNMKDIKRQLMDVARHYKLDKGSKQKLNSVIEDTLMNRPYDQINTRGFMDSLFDIRDDVKTHRTSRVQARYNRRVDSIDARATKFQDRYNAGEWRADKDVEKAIQTEIAEAMSRYVKDAMENFSLGNIENELKQVFSGLNEKSDMTAFKQSLVETVYNYLGGQTDKSDIEKVIKGVVGEKTYDKVDVENSISKIKNHFTKELNLSTDIMKTFKETMEKYVYNLVSDFKGGLESREGFLNLGQLSDEEAKRYVLDSNGHVDVKRTIEKRLEEARDIAEKDIKKADESISDIEKKEKDAMEKGGLSGADTRDTQIKQELAEFEAKLTFEKARQKELTEEIVRLEKEGASTDELGKLHAQKEEAEANIDWLEKVSHNRDLLLEMHRQAAEDERNVERYTLDEQKLFYESLIDKAGRNLESEDARTREKAEADITRYVAILEKIEGKIEARDAKEREKNDPMNIIANKFADAIKKAMSGNGGLDVDATGLATEATLTKIYEVLVGIVQAMGGKVIRDPEKDAKLARMRELDAKRVMTSGASKQTSDGTKTGKSSEPKAKVEKNPIAEEIISRIKEEIKGKTDVQLEQLIKDLASRIKPENKGTKEDTEDRFALHRAMKEYIDRHKNDKVIPNVESYKATNGDTMHSYAKIAQHLSVEGAEKLRVYEKDVTEAANNNFAKAEAVTQETEKQLDNAKAETAESEKKAENEKKAAEAEAAATIQDSKDELVDSLKTILEGVNDKTKGKENSLNAVYNKLNTPNNKGGLKAFEEFRAELLKLQSGNGSIEEATKKAQAFVDIFANYKNNRFADLSKWFGKDVQADATSLLGIVKQIFELTSKEQKLRKANKPKEEVAPAQQKAEAKKQEAAAEEKITEAKKEQKVVTSGLSDEEEREYRQLSKDTAGYHGPTVDFSEADTGIAKEETLLKIYDVLQKIKTEGIKKGSSTANKRKLNDADQAKLVQKRATYDRDAIYGIATNMAKGSKGYEYDALVKQLDAAVQDVEKYSKGKTKDEKLLAEAKQRVAQLSQRTSAMGYNIMKEASAWGYKVGEADVIETFTPTSRDALRKEMENLAITKAGGKTPEFLNFDGTKLEYQLVDLKGNVEKVTMEWSELNNQIAITSQKEVSKLDGFANKLGKFDEKFETASQMGYLDKNSEKFQAYETALKAVNAEIEAISKKDFVNDEELAKDIAHVEQLRANALQAADVVTKEIANNKKQYTGTREMNAADRQYGDLEAKGILDKTDLEMVEQYKNKYEEIATIQKKWAAMDDGKGLLRPEAQKELRAAALEAQKLGKQLEKSVAEAEQLEQLVYNSGTYNGKQMGGVHQVTAEETKNLEASMKSYLKSLNLGNVEHVKYDHVHQRLTGTLRTSNKTVSELEVKYNQATQALYAYNKAEKESLTGVPAFINGFQKKFNSIMQYLTMTMSIHRVISEVRRGVQYIKEIDLALTELRKVTDETEETYDRFLETAAKTGERLGSTISAVTEATATFAKLGYSIKDATEMAEAAIVYKNVGDNIASTEDAADSIISTLKGFGLESSQTMAIVDKFNEVGE